MQILETVFDFYFFTFITILPLSFIFATILFLVKFKEKRSFKTNLFISLFLLLNILLLIAILLFVLFDVRLTEFIGFNKYYLICFAIIFATYFIVTYIESIALNPKLYMKHISKNLELGEFKNFLLKHTIAQVAKVYIFIAYIAAIIILQFEGLEIYTIENQFLKSTILVCDNSITLILAFELLFQYRAQKKKEIKGLIKGGELYNTFIEFDMHYLKLYDWYCDELDEYIMLVGQKFREKITKFHKELLEKLATIRSKAEYETIKESEKIRTYNLVYDLLLESFEEYFETENETNLKRRITYITMCFQEILKKEVVLKNKQQLIKRINKFAYKNFKQSIKKKRNSAKR